MDLCGLAQGPVASFCKHLINLRILWKADNFLLDSNPNESVVDY
jgi:hypothetical protein